MKKTSLSILLTILSLSACYSQKRFITVDNAKICINILGLENRLKGQPVIVFQSGMGTPMGNWDPLLESVSKIAPLITYDRPGIGESDPLEEMPTIKNVSDRLIKILNYLKIDPPYVLVGHSLGGVYVRGFANYYPELLAGIVIIDPGDFTETQENKRQYFTDIGLNDFYIDSLFKKFDKESIENKNKSTTPKSIQNEGTVLEDLRKSDFKEIHDYVLPNIPVHILTGGRYDTPIRLRRTEYNDSLLFRSKMKHRSSRWIDVIQSVDKGMFFYSADAGHFVHRDDPELVISSINIVLSDYFLLKSKK
jgi:pimeloyl-ACP methyl ester carboxylesterase